MSASYIIERRRRLRTGPPDSMWSTAGPVGEKVLHMPAPWLGMWYHQRPAPLAGDEVLHSPGPPGWVKSTTNPSPLAGDEVLLPQPGGWKVNNSVKSVVKLSTTPVAAGSSNALVSTKPGKIFVPALAAGRYGSQLMTQKVVALQPIVPPAPPRSRSKSRNRAVDDASSSSRVDPVQAASASAADALAPLDPAALLSHGAAAASADGEASRHHERRSAEKQPSRKSRGNGPPSLAAALEKARLDQIDWC